MKKILSFLITALLLLTALAPMAAYADTTGATYFETDDVKDLKHKIGKNPIIQSALASTADSLGYCWCGGTRQGIVGKDFDVWLDGDDVHIKAHYDKNDPHAAGVDGDKMLEIVLSDFRYDISPSAVQLDMENKKIQKLDEVNSNSVELINRDNDKEATVENWMAYTKSATLSNEVNGSITNGMREQTDVKAEFKIDNVLTIGGQQSFEFSTSETHGWVNSTQTATSTTHTARASAAVSPVSKRVATAVQTISEATIPYKIDSGIVYKVTFNGYLRDSGNAKKDHPGGRVEFNYTFGDEKTDAFTAIYNGYRYGDSTWDWNWAKQNTEGFENLMNNIYSAGVKDHNFARVVLRGQFKVKGDSDTKVDIGPNLPINGGSPTTIQSGKYYKVINRRSGKVLDIFEGSKDEGAAVVQWDDSDVPNQQWLVTYGSAGFFNLRNRNSDMYLGIDNSSDDEGAAIVQLPYRKGASNQYWKAEALGGKYYKIVSLASGKVLAVRDKSTDNGTTIVQQGYNGEDNQQWEFVEVK